MFALCSQTLMPTGPFPTANFTASTFAHNTNKYFYEYINFVWYKNNLFSAQLLSTKLFKKFSALKEAKYKMHITKGIPSAFDVSFVTLKQCLDNFLRYIDLKQQ